ICSRRCEMAAAQDPIRGTRPVWNGRPPRLRRERIFGKRPPSCAGRTSITWKGRKMSSDNAALTAGVHARTHVAQEMLQEQYADLEQQHLTATTGMWVFLATEVMFFGTLFVSLAVYRFQYPQSFEVASERLNWIIGGGNTLVLLLSSFSAVLAVHYARLG